MRPSHASLSLSLSLSLPALLQVFSADRFCPRCVISRDRFEDPVQRTPSSNYWPALVVVAAKRIKHICTRNPPYQWRTIKDSLRDSSHSHSSVIQSLALCLERLDTNREILPRFSLSLFLPPPPTPVLLPVFSPYRFCPGCVISRDRFEDSVQRTPNSNYWPAHVLVAAKRMKYTRGPPYQWRAIKDSLTDSLLLQFSH